MLVAPSAQPPGGTCAVPSTVKVERNWVVMALPAQSFTPLMTTSYVPPAAKGVLGAKFILLNEPEYLPAIAEPPAGRTMKFVELMVLKSTLSLKITPTRTLVFWLA